MLQKLFIESITSRLKKEDGDVIRLSYPNRSYDVICMILKNEQKRSL